jgi:hypothetical protein
MPHLKTSDPFYVDTGKLPARKRRRVIESEDEADVDQKPGGDHLHHCLDMTRTKHNHSDKRCDNDATLS